MMFTLPDTIKDASRMIRSMSYLISWTAVCLSARP
jgi:hypothetical protein